jgi:hypothetical protein
MTYLTTYPQNGTRAFNNARITLHTLLERIHILRKRPQDIPRSPCPTCMVVASRTTDTQPLRTIGLSSSKPHLEGMGPGFTSPGGRILTFLPFHRCVVAEY